MNAAETLAAVAGDTDIFTIASDDPEYYLIRVLDKTNRIVYMSACYGAKRAEERLKRVFHMKFAGYKAEIAKAASAKWILIEVKK